MFVISKSIEFDYGHRVWTQKLNKDYAVNDECVCKHLHGHRGKLVVFLSANSLNDQGMVTDFKHLGWLKKFIDETIDHKFLLHNRDPLYNKIVGKGKALEKVIVPGTNMEAGYVINTTGFKGEEKNYYDSFFITDFVPTSENCSKWMWEIVHRRMSLIGVCVPKIEWYETPKSKSTYMSKI